MHKCLSELNLRLGIGLKSLNQIADWVVNEVQVALMRDVERSRSSTFLEKGACILHKLVEVEIDADSALQEFEVVLLEKQVVAYALRDLILSRLVWSYRQSFDSFNYQVAREVTADKADHLMIVESCYNFVVRRWMENFLHLLQERLSVELRGRHKCVFS